MASGHVEPYKNRKNHFRITVELGKDPKTKKRKRLKRSFKGTKRAANAELRKLLDEVEKGFHFEPADYTLSEYLEKWLAAHSVDESTRENYKIVIDKQIVPELGSLPLTEVMPMHVQEYLEKKKKNLSGRYVRYHYMILHSAFEQAVLWKMRTTSPMEGVTVPKAQEKEQNVLKPEEVKEYTKKIEGDPLFPLIYTALWTGMRRSELLGLRWQDVDLKAKVIRVVQALHIVDKEYVFGDVKSEKSKRSIPISNSLTILLQKLKDSQGEKKYKEQDLVFCNKDGTPLSPSTVTHRYRKITTAAGYPEIRLHDMRHTHATLLLKQGVHPKVVQERLGHASITTTMNIYSHVLPNIQEEAVLKLEDIIDEKAENEEGKNNNTK
jgi:integrase